MTPAPTPAKVVAWMHEHGHVTGNQQPEFLKAYCYTIPLIPLPTLTDGEREAMNRVLSVVPVMRTKVPADQIFSIYDHAELIARALSRLTTPEGAASPSKETR